MSIPKLVLKHNPSRFSRYFRQKYEIFLINIKSLKIFIYFNRKGEVTAQRPQNGDRNDEWINSALRRRATSIRFHLNGFLPFAKIALR